MWQRNFTSAAGTTIATYDAATKRGNVWWAGEPRPAPTPAPMPTPAPKPSDDEVLAIVKTNRQQWLRWIKKHDLAAVGNDPSRHTPAVRRRFIKDPNVKKLQHDRSVSKKPVEKPPERKAPAAKPKAKAKAAAVSPAAGLRGARISEVLSSARQAVRASSAFDVSHALTWSRDESC